MDPPRKAATIVGAPLVAIVRVLTAKITVIGALVETTTMTVVIDPLPAVDRWTNTAHRVDATMTLTEGITRLQTHMSTVVRMTARLETSRRGKVDMDRVKAHRTLARITGEGVTGKHLLSTHVQTAPYIL